MFEVVECPQVEPEWLDRLDAWVAAEAVFSARLLGEVEPVGADPSYEALAGELVRDAREVARIEARMAATRVAMLRHREPVVGTDVWKDVGTEVAWAEGVSPSEGQRRLGRSYELVERFGRLGALVADGSLPAEQAHALTRELGVLDTDLHEAALDRFLGPADGTDPAPASLVRELRPRSGKVEDVDLSGTYRGTHALWDLSPEQVRRAARRVVKELDADAAERRATGCRRGARVTAKALPDAVGVLTATMPVEDLAAVVERLDSDARTAKAAGSELTLDQLRVQHLVWRLSDGHLGTAPPGSPFVTRLVEARESGVVPTRSVTVIDLTVDAATALGLADVPASLRSGASGLAGDTTIDATTAREVLAAAMRRALDDPDAVQLRRILTCPTTGVALDATPRYRPTSRLAEWVGLRDRHSRFPGSTSPVRELDHVRPYRHRPPDDGESDTDAYLDWLESGAERQTCGPNLLGLGTRDHHVKHLPGWTVEPLDPDLGAAGPVAFTSPAGVRRVSHPPVLADPPF